MSSRKIKRVKKGGKEHGPKGIEKDSLLQLGGSLGTAGAPPGASGTAGAPPGASGTAGTAPGASGTAGTAPGASGTAGTAGTAPRPVGTASLQSPGQGNGNNGSETDSMIGQHNQDENDESDDGTHETKSTTLLEDLKKNVNEMKSENLKVIMVFAIDSFILNMKNMNSDDVKDFIEKINGIQSEQAELDGKSDVSVLMGQLDTTKKELADVKQALAMKNSATTNTLVKSISDALKTGTRYTNDDLLFTVTKVNDSFTISKTI